MSIGVTLARHVLRAAVFALLLLTWQSIAPSEALASCGDYLIHAPIVWAPAGSTTAISLLPINPSQPHVPCRGPGCSRGSSAPAGLPPVVVVTVDQWLCLGDLLPTGNGPQCRAGVESDMRYDSRPADCLERPPRCA